MGHRTLAGWRVGFVSQRGLRYGAAVYAAELGPEDRQLAAEIGWQGWQCPSPGSRTSTSSCSWAGFGTSTAYAVEVLDQSGTLVQVGVHHTKLTVSTSTIVTQQLQVLSSLSGTKQDLTELHELMRGGRLNRRSTGSRQRASRRDWTASRGRSHGPFIALYGD